MIRALLVLLLLATPASAVESIAIMGDSLAVGPVDFPSPISGYRVSRFSVDKVLFAELKHTSGAHLNATVQNWGVAASTPADWTGTPDATLCSQQQLNYPHLRAACAAGDGILNHVPSGFTFVIWIDDGGGTASGGTYTASQFGSTLVTLNTALDAVNGTVLLTPPPRGPSSSSDTALPADGSYTAKGDIQANMVSRSILSGPDWSSTVFPMSIDAIHFRDQAYAQMADIIAKALP